MLCRWVDGGCFDIDLVFFAVDRESLSIASIYLTGTGAESWISRWKFPRLS